MLDVGILEFYELIGADPSASAQMEDRMHGGGSLQAQTKPRATQNHAFEKADAFMDVLKSRMPLKENVLKAVKCGKHAPAGHPNDTKARPDIVIFQKEYSLEQKEDNVFWGSIEMAIEFHSAGKTREQRLEQAASYVSYLLRARPDLVSALGLLVEIDSLVFFFCNANGIKKLSLSNADDYLPLLSAILTYLNEGQTKNIDPTLLRLPATVLFNVSIPNGSASPNLTTYESCSLRYSRDPFGRRPNIFIYEPENNVSAVRVIKDQYVREDRSWVEEKILTRIHANGTYPAVVRMCFYGEITQARCGDRIRVRVSLQDYGTDFLSLKTPRDVIYALYDLLEVTRGLYFDRKILHRDISPWNIMIRDSEYSQPIETCSSASPVFIRHILDPQFVMLFQVQNIPTYRTLGRVPKHKSSIFLIDFGYSQDLESSRDGLIGTPMFIARAVQAGKPLPHTRGMYFPELPPLSESVKTAYLSNHPKRMELFKEKLGVQMKPWGEDREPGVFQHKLEHDGESGVWSSFWWALLAFPEQGENIPIDALTWAAVVPYYDMPRTGLPTRDDRAIIISLLVKRYRNMFHPGYGGLLSLFQDIAEAIESDYHWAEPGVRQLPDYVHEILQRIILNFIVKNMDERFMDIKKADKNRTVQGSRSTQYLSTSETDHRRASLLGSEPDSRKSPKRDNQETLPDPTPPKHAMSGDDQFGDNDRADEDAQHIEKKARTGDV